MSKKFSYDNARRRYPKEVLLTCKLNFVANVSTLGDINDAHSVGIIHVTCDRTTNDCVAATPQVNDVWSNVLRDEREYMMLRLTNSIFESHITLKWICSSNRDYTGFLQNKAQSMTLQPRQHASNHLLQSSRANTTQNILLFEC